MTVKMIDYRVGRSRNEIGIENGLFPVKGLVPAAEFTTRVAVPVFKSLRHEIVVVGGHVHREWQIGQQSMRFIRIVEVGTFDARTQL